MRLARQSTEHLKSVVLILGFAQHLTVENHHRVGADHDVVGVLFGDSPRLDARQIRGNLLGRDTVGERFFHIGHDDLEISVMLRISSCRRGDFDAKI